VDGADLSIWESSFQGVPASAVTAVPEPEGLVIGLTATLGLLPRRRNARG